LILDEPTIGLDPLQIIGIRNLIKNLAHEKTIILSTHILPEVATISDRILVINNGRIVADDTFENLRDQVTERSAVNIAVKCSKKDFQSAIGSISGVEDVVYDDEAPRGVVGCKLYFKPSVDIITPLNKIIRNHKWDLLNFHQEKISLEESFIRLTKSQGEEGGAA